MPTRHSNRKAMLSRPSNVLKAIENKAVDIRKLLADVKKPVDQRAWKERGDAMRLAATIEAVASRGADLHAADAIHTVELLELMFEQLETMVDRILAS